VIQCVIVCCSVLQCVAVRCSVLQCVAVCCSVSQCVAVCCSVLQCVAVCYNVSHCGNQRPCAPLHRCLFGCGVYGDGGSRSAAPAVQEKSATRLIPTCDMTSHSYLLVICYTKDSFLCLTRPIPMCVVRRRHNFCLCAT